MKICSSCSINKENSEYHKKSKASDGLNPRCKDCRKLYHIARVEEFKSIYQLNKDKVKLIKKQYYHNNSLKIKSKIKIYASNNRGKLNAKIAKYKTSKLQATPKWLTEHDFKQIESIYKMSDTIKKLTGIKCHVDHIYPLQGETSCGLHIPSNLQITTADYNMSKGNKLFSFIKF